MVRSYITPDKTDFLLRIPAEYIGKKLEILIYAVDELVEMPQAQPASVMAQFWGTLSDESAQDILRLSAESREGWERNTIPPATTDASVAQ